MKPEGNGRFCENCKKTIIDFSSLSDQELYRYLSGNTSITCGRFHNDQLNKNIFPVETRHNYFKGLSGAAAALFALLTMRSVAAENSNKAVAITVQPLVEKNPLPVLPADVIISGQVKDFNNNLLEKAEIRIGDSIVAITDKEGKFSLELKDVDKPFIFFIQRNDMMTAVRNYHPAMLSAEYNIILESKISNGCCNTTMGIIMPDTASFPSITIELAKNSKRLNSETKLLLSTVATWMRNNPELTVIISGYIRRKNQTDIARKIQDEIKKYLVDWEGISEDRIKAKTEVIAGMKESLFELRSSYYGND